MSQGTKIWGWAASVLLAGALTLVTRQLVGRPSLPLPTGGHRGRQRREALESPLFSLADPALRLFGALARDQLRDWATWGPTARARVEQLEEAQRKQLVWAGEPFGLDRYEVFAISAILFVAGAGLGFYLGMGEGTLAWVVPVGLVAAASPNVRLQALTTERFTEMSRELPAAIDLIALSMNAGSDFPGAIRRVIAGQPGVVGTELGLVLHALDLGITRQGALLALRERIPVQEVRDLVRAVTLAEKKGASITEALGQQARSSRQRRSVRAEEAAARAGVLLLVPLMLLMGCIMILLVGPLMTSGAGL